METIHTNRFATLAEHLDVGPTNPKRKKVKSTRSNNTNLLNAWPELSTPTYNPNKEAKFVTVESATENKTLRDVNPFVLARKIKGITSQISKVKYMANGNLILCNNTSTAEKLINTKSIDTPTPFAIKVNYHHKLNQVTGTIYSPLLMNLSEETIAQELSHEGVIKARHITKIDLKNPDKRRNTGLIVLTLDRWELPKTLDVGFERVSVREYLPKPMQCRHCWNYGHTVKFCKSKLEKAETCKTCGSENIKEHTCDKVFCVPCKSIGHSSDCRQCPQRIKEEKILLIQTRQKMSRYEARKFYYENEDQTNVPIFSSYTAALTSKPVLTLNQASTSTSTPNSTPKTLSSNNTQNTSIKTNHSVQQNLTQINNTKQTIETPKDTNKKQNNTLEKSPTKNKKEKKKLILLSPLQPKPQLKYKYRKQKLVPHQFHLKNLTQTSKLMKISMMALQQSPSMVNPSTNLCMSTLL